MIWVLVVFAALPLIMGALLFVLLRRGVHHRLHQRRMTQDPGQTSFGPDVAAGGWSTTDPSFSGGGGDSGGSDSGGGGGSSGD